MECLLKMRCRRNSGPHFFVLKCCEEQFAQNRALLGPGFWEREKEGGKLPGKRRKKGLRMRNPFLLLLANIGDANFSIIWMHSDPSISGL